MTLERFSVFEERFIIDFANIEKKKWENRRRFVSVTYWPNNLYSLYTNAELKK